MATHVCRPVDMSLPHKWGRDKWVLRASWSASQPSSARDPFLGSKAGIDRGSYLVLLWPSHESLPCKGGFKQELKERMAREKDTTLFCERCGLLKRVANLLEFFM